MSDLPDANLEEAEHRATLDKRKCLRGEPQSPRLEKKLRPGTAPVSRGTIQNRAELQALTKALDEVEDEIRLSSAYPLAHAYLGTQYHQRPSTHHQRPSSSQLVPRFRRDEKPQLALYDCRPGLRTAPDYERRGILPKYGEVPRYMFAAAPPVVRVNKVKLVPDAAPWLRGHL